MTWKEKQGLRAVPCFEMVAEHYWKLVLLALWFGADGGTCGGSKATYLSVKKET